eukprot:1390537-Rhodomonas_salina.1
MDWDCSFFDLISGCASASVTPPLCKFCTPGASTALREPLAQAQGCTCARALARALRGAPRPRPQRPPLPVCPPPLCGCTAAVYCCAAAAHGCAAAVYGCAAAGYELPDMLTVTVSRATQAGPASASVAGAGSGVVGEQPPGAALRNQTRESSISVHFVPTKRNLRTICPWKTQSPHNLYLKGVVLSLISGCICLRACYAMPGTDTAYGAASGLRSCE